MAIKIGNVIENKNGLYVITSTEYGIVTDTEKLEEFIMKHAFVQEDGEWKTIKDVVEKRCGMYLDSGIEIIKEK